MGTTQSTAPAAGATPTNDSPRDHPRQGIRLLARPAVIALLLTGSALARPPQVDAGSITYDIINYGTPPASFTGTITTDGNLGAIGTGDITSWDITVNGLPPYTPFTFTPLNSAIDTMNFLGLQATPQTLTLTFVAGMDNVLDFSADNEFVRWRVAFVGPLNILFEVPAILKGVVARGPAGAAPIASVPEPTSSVLAALGAVGGLAFGWACNRRQGRRRRPVGQPVATD